MRNTLLITLILSVSYLFGQNLVPNSSFENFSYCPVNINDFNIVENWYLPTACTSDYFNQNNSSQLPVCRQARCCEVNVKIFATDSQIIFVIIVFNL